MTAIAPNSSGTGKPRLHAPKNTCDCHMHIYDGGRFPPPRPDARMQPQATVAAYRLLQQRIGTSRTVVVTPAAYVTSARVRLARQQLALTSKSIEQIANATGFPNRHYFTRVFTRQVGCGPAEFRARQQRRRGL